MNSASGLSAQPCFFATIVAKVMVWSKLFGAGIRFSCQSPRVLTQSGSMNPTKGLSPSMTAKGKATSVL